jgi:prepilin-type N-terminal cleavage/methylation domain-containing protein
MKPIRKAFTLIELLVVVAIISLLISVLLPSLQKAKYLAKFSSCSANLHRIGVGMMCYVAEHDGWYPYRQIKGFELIRYEGLDDRQTLRPYLPINTITCPFSPVSGVNLDTTDERAVYMGYSLVGGQELVQDNPTTRLWKVNDVPVYDGNKFDILAADFLKGYYLGGVPSALMSGHPARDGRLQFVEHKQDYAGAWWVGYSSAIQEGLGMDRNFLHTDGSVRGLMGLKLPDDSRTYPIRNRGDQDAAYYYYFPPK